METRVQILTNIPALHSCTSGECAASCNLDGSHGGHLKVREYFFPYLKDALLIPCCWKVDWDSDLMLYLEADAHPRLTPNGCKAQLEAIQWCINDQWHHINDVEQVSITIEQFLGATYCSRWAWGCRTVRRGVTPIRSTHTLVTTGHFHPLSIRPFQAFLELHAVPSSVIHYLKRTSWQPHDMASLRIQSHYKYGDCFQPWDVSSFLK